MTEEREELSCECQEIHEDLLKIVNETMPDEEELYDLADLFKVFADSTRIRILFVLFESEVCVCDLAKVLNMTQSAVSHQLLHHEAEQAGEEPQTRKIYFLFPCR